MCPPTSDGPLSQAQIDTLSAGYGLSVDLLRGLSRRLGPLLSTTLTVRDPDLLSTQDARSVRDARKAIANLKLAERHLEEAMGILKSLQIKFMPELGLMGSPPGIREQKFRDLKSAKETIIKLCRQTERVSSINMFQTSRGPDKRKLKDYRRELLCVIVFRLWERRAEVYPTQRILVRLCELASCLILSIASWDALRNRPHE